MNDNSIVGNVLTIQIQQVTPIIHFQYKQYGATLRATEVKPKLDKFLLKKISLNDAKENHWLIDAKHNSALDYRLLLENIGKPQSWYGKHTKKNSDGKYYRKNKDVENEIPLFFGNTGHKNSTEEKELVYYPDGINLKIFSLHTDLLKVIQEHICEFFALNNFGTRQSKGFGSYYVKMGTPCYRDISNFMGKGSDCVLKSCFTVNIPEELFDDINLLYTSMRSGAFPFESDKYCASAMYAYLDKILNKVWDRKVIRDIIDQEMTEEQASSYSLYRDVLGLASYTSYGHNQGTITKTIPSVQRFKSPIFIKPVFANNKSSVFRVYVGFFDIPKKYNIIGRTVTIEGKKLSVKPRGDKPARSEIHPFKQEIGKDFTLSDYISYLFTDFSIEEYLPDGHSSMRDRLKEIYHELQQTYNK